MQPLAQLCRDLADGDSAREAMGFLAEKYTILELAPTTGRITFFDSFDWRLYEKKQLCFLQDNLLCLTDFGDQQLAPVLPCEALPSRFWWKFPQSDIKNGLAEILDVRALLPQAVLCQQTTELRILNKDKKTVALVLFAELNPGEDTIPNHSAQLLEVRGYNKWFMKLSRDLARFGQLRPDTNVHVFALAANGRSPMDYSSRLNIPLAPNLESHTAAKIIFRNLLDTLLVNRQGIVDDIDIEFLHDFRVAIRRTRSGLTLIREVLPEEVSNRFKEDFRYLGQITGPVRDLDVYLHMEENYKARLPEHLQEGLHYFFADLAKKRKKAQAKLVQDFAAPRYPSIVAEWRDYLNREDMEDTLAGKNSQLPIERLAKKIITKRFKRVLRDGEAIHTGTADGELHRLRIQGKKLRYSLEFFNGLFPDKEMKKLIRQLKQLQNNLGDFNDLSVQQDMLKEYLEAIRPGTIKSKKLSAAIGGLLTNLFHEHNLVRTRFEETFSRFSTPENLELYRRLFG